jgi:Na+/H+ antiporter NhaC
VADACTANNTVAIILSGGLAKEIADKNGIDPRRSASILDIFSCVFQGIMPYAAQVLLAGSIAGISPVEVVGGNYYCFILAVVGLLAIMTGRPRIKS